LVREIADRHGATLVDVWRLRALDDPRMWDVDRLHLSAAGHHRIAIAVLDALGVEHALQPAETTPLPVLTPRSRRAADLAWARIHLGPWVKRRLTGTSSGDTLEARRPVPARLGAAAATPRIVGSPAPAVPSTPRPPSQEVRSGDLHD
jgi:phosphoglycolate phosphatase-like HAD superfamily hydrolase